MSNTIDVETVDGPPAAPIMALERRQDMGLGRALTVEELHERLEFVRRVMKQEMREGTDYGKIPGTGDKPSLLQPGAQKLLMTFNLRAQVLKETLRHLAHPSVPGHREYEFTIRVFPSGAEPGTQGTDGVGTCSTLESKYRYRKATRKCPQCGKSAIIAGKEEFGGGFICWKKKDGCGAKYASDDRRITGQSVEDVENEDAADCWNTVRKMGFKRGLVSAVINFTNTSELWTQDVEDMAGGDDHKPAAAAKPAPTKTAQPAQSAKPAPAPAPVNAPGKPELKLATEATRQWMERGLNPMEDLAVEYFQKLANPAVLMPGEGLKDLPWQWVPITSAQLKALQDAITEFGNGADAKHPYAPNPVAEATKPKAAKPKADPQPAKSSVEMKIAELRKKAEWFWPVIIPVPHKGMKKADYDKKPDTIEGLYTAVKEGDQAAQARLFGLAKKWNPEPREWNGKIYQPTDADHICRAALDDFADWEEKHRGDAQPDPEDGQDDIPF